MKSRHSEILLIISLSLLSALIYLIQNMIFHHLNDTMYYLMGDLAFIPIQVIIVSLVIDRLVNYADKRNNTKRVNVVISSFFTEAGTALMSAISNFNRNQSDLCNIIANADFKKNTSLRLKKELKMFRYDVYADPDKLESFKTKISIHKPYMLRMLENSNLIEHDSFTDMLWAVFHVADELEARELNGLSDADVAHLSNDFLRAYSALNLEWISYMEYLEKDYPYLFSLAIRKNPFNG